jgi:PAS domain S-box-containing protein
MVHSSKSDREIKINQEEFDRFRQLKEEYQLSDSQAFKTLLDHFETYQQEFKPLKHQLQTYRQREMKALSIGDAISDGIYVTDGDGVVLEVNTRFCQLIAMEAGDLIGLNIQTLVDKGVLSNPVVLEVLKRKTKVSDMSTISKTSKKVLSTGNPFYNDRGKLVQVLVVMRDITELIKLKEELEAAEMAKNRYLRELELFRLESQQSDRIIGQSDSLLKIKELISQISQVDSTVLITGDTGVGKEVIAYRIYEKSNRKEAPYIRINCAAMPESLMESELFGYDKGAFTGARSQGKPGVFEMADKGTILLDEIGDMPINLQPKLLRVLQEREVTRIGDTKSIRLDVRVLATTNQNLVELVKAGRFRKDLFYRINVIPIHVPPLCDRKEDIPFLVEHFLNQFKTKYNHQATFSPPAIESLKNYNFPGNVRELKNIVERLVVTDKTGLVTSDDFFRIVENQLPETLEYNPDKMSLKEAVSQFERRIVVKTVKQHGSTYKAAKILGISQPSVVRKTKPPASLSM